MFPRRRFALHVLRRPLLTVVTALLTGFGLIGAVSAQTYTVGTYATPFGFAEGEELQGFSVEVMKAIAADAGFEVGFALVTVATAPGALLDGTIDIIAGPYAVTSERIASGIAFSGIYARYTEALLVLATDTRPYTSLADFTGEAIGANGGNVFTNHLIAVQARDNLFREVVDVTPLGGFDALRSGAVKAILNASFIIPARQRRGLDVDIRMVETYVPSLHYSAALAVREADTDLLGLLQRSLSKLIADGTIAEMAARWGINPP